MSARSDRRVGRALAWAALLVLITIGAYVPALRAGYVWDDDFHVTQNAPLKTLGGIGTIWTSPTALPQYYPLVHSTFWLEYRLWGLQPFGYHLVNVLLHALAAVLLWRALARLAVPGAWLAGAIFALHPVHVESVAWITERKNVLSAVLYLAALLCFVAFHRIGVGSGPRAARRTAPAAEGPDLSDSSDAHEPRDWRLYAAGSAFFLLALLSKTVAFSLPAAVLLIVWWKKGRIAWRDALQQAPLLVAGAAFGLMTAWLEKHHVGAQGGEWSLSPVERVLVAGRALWFYAGKLVWPSPLAFVYPRWSVDATRILPFAFPVGFLLAAGALALFAKRMGRGPAAAVLFFAGTLLPALGFFDVYPMRYAYVADHYQYLASAGLIALACGLVALWFARATVARSLPSATGPILAVAVLAVLGVLTWRQCGAYHDAESLWRDTLAKNPDAWMAHDNLGLILVGRGELDDGIRHYREAVRLHPREPSVRSNLGIALAKKGSHQEAVAELTRALEIDPDLVEARYNLGTALLRGGDFPRAAKALEEVVRRVPSHAQAHNNLAMALRRVGREDDAIDHYRAALAIEPRLTAASFNLAASLDAQGRLEDAAGAYAHFLTLEPQDAEAESHYSEVLSDLGRTEEAAFHAGRAHRLSSASSSAGESREPAAGTAAPAPISTGTVTTP